MQLTKQLFDSMQPVRGRTYRADSIPSQEGKATAVWSNNDEQYIIKADCTTRTISGHFYDWNEETQDWDDANDVQMTDEQLMAIIKRDNLIFA